MRLCFTLCGTRALARLGVGLPKTTGKVLVRAFAGILYRDPWPDDSGFCGNIRNLQGTGTDSSASPDGGRVPAQRSRSRIASSPGQAPMQAGSSSAKSYGIGD